VFSLESPAPERAPFDLARARATRYRTDDLQPLYFVIDSMEALLALAHQRFGLDPSSSPLSERLSVA
jgi:phenylalanine-4-hydroxylase